MDRRARTFRAVAAGLLPCLLATACGEAANGVHEGSRAGARRPNVLLISLDSTRRDLLSCYGHRPIHAPDRPTSPNLDRLAAEGVRLRDAYASSSWTLVSHLSLMTGHPALAHGVDDSFQTYAGRSPLLAEVLRGAGYRTAGFFSGPLLEPHYGFGRGFDRYDACYGARLAEASASASRLREARDTTEDPTEFERVADAYKRAKMELMELSHRDVSSVVVTDAVLDELARCADDERPFFLFAHYFDPHYDYAPPAEHEAFDPDYAGAIDGVDFFNDPRIAGPKDGVKPRERRISERDLEHVRALYEGELAWTDAEIGRILTRLRELGLLDDTLVVVTADHGDEFFEHGSIGHRRTLYEELVQVPLILRFPPRLPRGASVGGLVSLADVPATIAELVGLEPVADTAGDPTVEPAGLGGRSFARLLTGEAPADAAGPAGAVETERSVMLRVMRSHAVTIGAEGYGKFPGTQFLVTDAFRRGPIKITRTRVWARPREVGSAERQAALAPSLAAQRAHETLVWVDLERHPDEPPSAHSNDFTEPRAHAALQAFRAAYASAMEQRVPGAVSKGRQRFTALLKGLGYVDDDVSEDDETLDEDFLLPAPGERLLGGAR